MIRRALILLLALALLALAAGCGASAEGDDDAVDTDTSATETTEDTEAAPLAASEIVQGFRRSAEGAQLESTADVAWEQLGLGLDASRKELDTFGTFTIYVVEPGNEEAAASLLSDKDTARPLEADANGIRWDYDELARSQVAYKRYGSNVVLAWWNERREPGTDERWERLDALLTSLIAS